MSEDLLERATRALRETSAEPYLRAGATRARVLTSAQRKYAARHATLLRWALVGAALFASGTALAARLTGGLPELLRALTPWGESEPLNPPKHARKPASEQHAQVPSLTDAPTQSPEQVQVHAPAQPSIDATPPRVPPPPEPMIQAPVRLTARPTPRHRTTGHPSARRLVEATADSEVQPQPTQALDLSTSTSSASAAASAPSAPTTPTELTLFRRADRLHRARDPHALAAWDDYLKAAPSGTLAPEARYNRALCLIRLRKFDEARTALAPFADGAHGNYRKAEADALLRGLPED